MNIYSNTNRLKKLKKELLKINIANNHYISEADIKEICSCLSKETGYDLLNNYKDGTLNYKNMRTETLKELDNKILIVGNGEDTVILIDDV